MSNASIQDLVDAATQATPVFKPCSACGQLTSGGGMCWSCHEARHRAQRARELAEAAVPPGFAWSTLSSPLLVQRCHGDDMLVARARSSIGERRVVLVGASGRGKTSLAIAMMRAWVNAKLEPAVFAMAPELATCRKRERFGREAFEVLEALSAPLLVLDDIGTEFASDSSPITEIVFKRHADAKPTWFTTWMGPDEVRSRYGDGFARRVFQGARIIDCSGEQR